MTTCHVKGCQNPATKFKWFPYFGCGLGFCDKHNDTPEEDRADWILEAGRAKEEHDQGMSQTRQAFGVPD